MQIQKIADEVVGAYPIAFVTQENEYRWILNYPGGSVAIFPTEKMANDYANDYNNNHGPFGAVA